MKELAEYLFSRYNSSFNNFKDSIEEYRFSSGDQNRVIVFCRMTLIIIERDLNDIEWKEFCIYLQDIVKKSLGKEELKRLEEYKILRQYVQHFYYSNDIKIVKRESPDFIVTLENGAVIGVEITKFVDDTGAVVHKIAADNFGRGKTVKEIKKIASEKYPKIYRDIKFSELSGGSTIIGRNNMINVTNEHIMNAMQILEKYKKFQKWSDNDYFDERIILCESHNPISLTNKMDFEEITNIVFNAKNYLGCKAVIFSAYDGFEDNWGILDIKNRRIELSEKVK